MKKLKNLVLLLLAACAVPSVSHASSNEYITQAVLLFSLGKNCEIHGYSPSPADVYEDMTFSIMEIWDFNKNKAEEVADLLLEEFQTNEKNGKLKQLDQLFVKEFSKTTKAEARNVCLDLYKTHNQDFRRKLRAAG